MEITIKKVLDKDGALEHLELHQSGQIIKVSLGSTALDSLKTTYKWNTLRELIDSIQSEEQQSATARLKKNHPGAGRIN
jgi:hypothetical protein